jgi:hypothetical protein
MSDPIEELTHTGPDDDEREVDPEGGPDPEATPFDGTTENDEDEARD